MNMICHVPAIASDFPKRYTAAEARKWEDHFIAGYAILRRREQKRLDAIEEISDHDRKDYQDQIEAMAKERPVTFDEIQEYMGLPGTTISRIIKSLRATGRLFSSRNGRTNTYSAAIHRKRPPRPSDDAIEERCKMVEHMLSSPMKKGEIMKATGLTKQKADTVLTRLTRSGRVITERHGTHFIYKRA